MTGHRESGIALLILLLVGLWLWFRNGFSVSTSVAGTPTPADAKTLTTQNVGSFGFAPDNAQPIQPYSPTSPPAIADNKFIIDTAAANGGPTSYGMPVIYGNTLDTSGLSIDNHAEIQSASFHPTVA